MKMSKWNAKVKGVKILSIKRETITNGNDRTKEKAKIGTIM